MSAIKFEDSQSSYIPKHYQALTVHISITLKSLIIAVRMNLLEFSKITKSPYYGMHAMHSPTLIAHFSS